MYNRCSPGNFIRKIGRKGHICSWNGKKLAVIGLLARGLQHAAEFFHFVSYSCPTLRSEQRKRLWFDSMASQRTATIFLSPMRRLHRFRACQRRTAIAFAGIHTPRVQRRNYRQILQSSEIQKFPKTAYTERDLFDPFCDNLMPTVAPFARLGQPY